MYFSKIPRWARTRPTVSSVSSPVRLISLVFSFSHSFCSEWQVQMKKASRETQTLFAGCSKTEPEIFAPQQTPFPGAQDGQNLISWRWSLPLPTNPVGWGSMHAISSYRGYRPTHPQTHRQDRLQYTAPQLASAQCNQTVYITQCEPESKAQTPTLTGAL